MLDIVISNKCKKDLRRAKKRGLDLNDFFAVVEEGYSGVVLKTWSVKVVVAVCSGGSSSSGGLLRRRSSASPRFASIAHLAWWDGVSHVVTRPAREHVT